MVRQWFLWCLYLKFQTSAMLPFDPARTWPWFKTLIYLSFVVMAWIYNSIWPLFLNFTAYISLALSNQSGICILALVVSKVVCNLAFVSTHCLPPPIEHSPSPWASCQIRKIAGAHMPGTFSPSPQVSDPDMHHDTCVTHMPWCMLGSLTSSSLWNRRRGKRSRHSRCMRNLQF